MQVQLSFSFLMIYVEIIRENKQYYLSSTTLRDLREQLKQAREKLRLIKLYKYPGRRKKVQRQTKILSKFSAGQWTMLKLEPSIDLKQFLHFTALVLICSKVSVSWSLNVSVIITKLVAVTANIGTSSSRSTLCIAAVLNIFDYFVFLSNFQWHE